MSYSPTCIVTGGTGMLGHGIRSALEDIHTDINFVWLGRRDGDCKDFRSMAEVFEKYRPTHIIHLAARVGGLYANMNDNIGFFEDNSQINKVILTLCHQYQVTHGIFCLSTCIFPISVDLPLTEQKIHDGPPHHSNEGYATAKRNLEMLVRFYRRKYGYNWRCVIPTNIYGPFDNFDLKDSHVIPGLIHECYLAKKNQTEFIIKGSGKALRQFIYSYDAGKLILKILLSNNDIEKYDSYILCDSTSNEYSINEVAAFIVKAFQFTGSVRNDTNFADGAFQKTASNKRLEEHFKDALSFTNLESGIQETVDWFSRNYDNCRNGALT